MRCWGGKCVVGGSKSDRKRTVDIKNIVGEAVIMHLGCLGFAKRGKKMYMQQLVLGLTLTNIADIVVVFVIIDHSKVTPCLRDKGGLGA